MKTTRYIKKSMVYDMINALSEVEESENDLSSFNEYLTAAIKDEKNDTTGLRDAVTGIQYGYGLDPQIYTENIDGSITKSDTEGAYPQNARRVLRHGRARYQA